MKTWPDGTEYTGEFLNGEQHGSGEVKYPNGETYIGDWCLNVRQGRGKLVLSNGDVIEVRGDASGRASLAVTIRREFVW